MNYKKKVCSLVLFNTLLLLLSGSAIAQDYSTVHPSPNIGWNLSGVKQNNNLYSGTTAIQIPITEFTAGRLSFPISLEYYNRAIPVDQLPSWIGLNWNLNAGGQITRIVNGKPDELRETKSFTLINTTISGGTANSQVVNTQIPTTNDFAYLVNYDKLNVANWNTNNYLFGTLNTLPAIEQLPNAQIITNLDNSTVTTNSNLAFDLTRNYDFEPDEWNFRVGGISGKFYLNHEGRWICESPNGNFIVEPSIATNIGKDGVIGVLRVIYRFTLTGPDGTKYIFGGTPENKLQNVEYWRGPAGVSGGPETNSVFALFGNSYLNVCPSAWQLTKIQTPNNEEINFEYQRGKLQLLSSDAPFGEGTNTLFKRDFPGYLQQSIAEPWYPKKITSSAGFVVDFYFEDSHQLGTDKFLSPNASVYTTFASYPDIAGQVLAEKNNLQKLTGVKISNTNGVIKSFKFEYTDQVTERLKLTSLKEVSPDGSTVNSSYSFTYNPGLLPNYASGKVDHFGFYNNKRFFADNVQTQYSISRTDFETQYFASREPDIAYSVYETLDKIYFPTGGFRKFTYEANDYSSAITRWPFGITILPSNNITGGIRISRITDFTDVGTVASESEFVYKTDMGGSQSSGVLLVPTPKYTDDKSSGGYYFSTRSFIPLDRSQGHIGYSTVFEKRSDGSYTKYEFTNAGPGANDAAPFYETPTPAFEDKASYTNNSFKRGLNKNLYQYNSSGTEVSRTENKYQDQFDDYSRYIRSVRLKRGDQATGAGFRVTAYPQYYFPNMLRVKKEVVSSSSGSISNEVSYVYDAQNRVITETSKNSLSEIVSTSYMYPNDFSVSSPYGEMVTRNIISPVIGQTTTNVTLGKELAKSRTNYSFWAGSQFIRPASIQKSVSGNVLETSATINAYDEKGNILQKTDKNGAIVSLFWGYNQQYPVAKVEGKSYQDALTQSGINLSVINNPSATDQNMRIELDRLRLLTNCFVTTYTYKPLVGMTSETDPNGKTVYFEYDQFNRLSLVRDQDNNIVKKVCYNFFGKPEDCPIQTNTLPVWRPTGNTRCQPCPANSSYNSGLKEKEERDINPNSATVGTTRWVVDASLGTCPSPADWVNGFAYCEQASVSPFGYTGNQVITQVDANPCSPTYNETHLLIIPNNAACPVCSSACNTPSQKCINGVCVTGTWSIIKTKKIGKTGPWECTYAYCFPDGTISSYTQVVTSSTACTIACY